MLPVASLRSAAFRLALVCTAMFLALPVIAAPRPQRMDDPGTQYPEFAGGLNDMPVNCVVMPRELLAHARGIPAVREAMNEFEGRGYVPLPDLDLGVNGCPEPMSFAGLAYRRPVAWLDPTHGVIPMILVATRINSWTGEPLTTVSAGLAVFDFERGVVFSGDSLGTLEPSFDVRLPRGGGGRAVLPERMDFGFGQSRFNRFLDCRSFVACAHAQSYPPCDPPREYPATPCNNWIEPLWKCLENPATRCVEVFF